MTLDTVRQRPRRPSSTIRPFPRPRLMTWEEFQTFATDNTIRVMVPPPYHVRPCDCGDVNCHGWRFVAGTVHR